MKISFEGRVWDYDEDRVSVQQAVAIHLAYGFTLAKWLEAIGEMDPRAWQCAYWLMLAQNGETKAIKDCEFALVDFMQAYADAQRAGAPAAEPEPPAVPTIPSPPGGPPSPEPSTQAVTTPRPPGPVPAATVS